MSRGIGLIPLLDGGNKRLGWLATAVFLQLNGVEASSATNDAVYRLVMGVAAGDPEVPDLARDLSALFPDRGRPAGRG